MSLKIRHTVTFDDPYSRSHKVCIVCVCVWVYLRVMKLMVRRRLQNAKPETTVYYHSTLIKLSQCFWSRSNNRSHRRNTHTHTHTQKSRWACSTAKYLRIRLFSIFTLGNLFVIIFYHRFRIIQLRVSLCTPEKYVPR